uniref:E3 ubiquitin-protein ligase listerin n=1 Tax=Setaria digitata TaxID=48799 RepID=A0A915PRK9_9BILA
MVRISSESHQEAVSKNESRRVKQSCLPPVSFTVLYLQRKRLLCSRTAHEAGETASSARAAELLTNSGHTVQIITFGDCERFTSTSLENYDADEDLHDAELQIALRKTFKKDSLTREKGLKELRRLIDGTTMDDCRKSFKHFVTLFPKLSFDGIVAVRYNVVRVLGAYIKKLQKYTEPYLIKVLSYVMFLMHDSYTQVVNESKSMLTDCFPNEKYAIVIEKCKEPVCELSLRLITGTHSLMNKNEGEETAEQRQTRLVSQGLQCLQWIFSDSLDEQLRKRIFEIFSSSSLKRLLSLSGQVASGIFILASSVTTVSDGWEAILNSTIPTTALARLDDPDRSVCRASAHFILQLAKSKKLFDVLDIDKAVLRRTLSLVSRKKNHWNHISASLVPLLKAILEEKTESDGRLLLMTAMNAFFDGMPWKLSFPSIAWVDTFVEFTEFAIWWTISRCADDLDVVVDEFVPKVWTAMKCTLKWGDKSLVRKIVHLPGRIISKCTNYPETASRVRCQIEEHLLNELPSTEELIEELFCDGYEPISSTFLEQLLRNISVSQKLTSALLEKCSDNVLEDINSRLNLCQAISSKINWDDTEDTALLMLKLLIKFATMFGNEITEFYKLNDELSSIRFLTAFGLLDTGKYSAINFVSDEVVLIKAMQFCVDHIDVKRWGVLVDVVGSFPCFQAALQQVLIENRYRVDQQLLTTLLSKQGQKISENLRSKLVDLVIKHLFETEASSETINETVKMMASWGVNLKSVAQIITNKLSAADLQFDYCVTEIATTIATLLPSSSAADFVINYSDLIDKFAALDEKYGLEIMENQECLASSSAVKSLFSGKMRNDSTLLPHLNYAVFIINYLDVVAKDNIECTTSFLYAVAVSSLAFINTIISEDLVDTSTVLNSLVNRVILGNEELRDNLLSECTSLIGKGSGSLCLFLALRRLIDGLSLERIETLFKDFAKTLDPFRLEFCCAALRFQGAVCDDYCNPPSSMKQWTGRFELMSSLRESVNPLQLLVQFMTEGRSVLEEYVFTYSCENEESEERNVFNCALLRFLTHCCAHLKEMDTAMRDFLCCALITSLESANALWGNCESQSYMLFSEMSIRLFNECSQIIKNTGEDVMLAHFRQEWLDFFCSAAQNILLVWFLGLVSYQESLSAALQNALCLSVNYITDEFIRTASLPPIFDVELDFSNYDEHLQSIVIPLQTLIKSSSPNVQIASLKLLKFITGDMLKIQNKRDEENDLEDEKLPSSYEKYLPVPFTRILDDPDDLSCILSPQLLIWDAFIDSLNQFELLEKVAYYNAMGPYMDRVMPHLFGLLPHSANIKYVTKSISPLIWKAECNLFASHKMPNKLKVRLLRAARQIVAEYDLEDSVMTLTIEYPTDYPLSVPLIEDERAIVSRETRRKWLLQLTMFLTHQNGSIVDAVLMWAGNIERHMEGAEDCTICMMTVHSRTYQLPRVRCKQYGLANSMGLVELTRREIFSASHRLQNTLLNDAENRQLYGKCNNLNGHGHNYVWEVTLRGPVDPKTGMVYNLADLKKEMESVMDVVDHKNLDKDVNYFEDRVSTTENLVVYLWNELKSKIRNPELLFKMVLHETEKNSVTYHG